jgi:hypothetical protein
MPQLIDCYFLVENRYPKTIMHFIGEFLPQSEESADEYEVPIYYDNPDFIFQDASSLLEYLFEHKDVEYSIYWRNKIPNAIIQHGMVFYTNDGNMILGASIIGKDPLEEEALRQYNLLGEFLDSKIGCITVEEAPPYNSNEFIEFAKGRLQP